jgi:hypothetical protein
MRRLAKQRGELDWLNGMLDWIKQYEPRGKPFEADRFVATPVTIENVTDALTEPRMTTWMDYSVQATIHGTSRGPMAKHSLFNAIKDAVELPDLTLVYIEPNNGRPHISGPEIRSVANSHSFAAYEARLLAQGRTRD